MTVKRAWRLELTSGLVVSVSVMPNGTVVLDVAGCSVELTRDEAALLAIPLLPLRPR